ncbi:MAG: TMEM175 family protein, partial [Chloroflexota bacterium]
MPNSVKESGIFNQYKTNFDLFRAKGAADNVRLNAMSDGVFAIVITLMVYEIKIPKIAVDRIQIELPFVLNSMIPQFLT